MDFIEIHNDTHSFLVTKIEKFKPDKNKKAYFLKLFITFVDHSHNRLFYS